MVWFGEAVTTWPERGEGMLRFKPVGCDHLLSVRSKTQTSPSSAPCRSPPSTTRQAPVMAGHGER